MFSFVWVFDSQEPDNKSWVLIAEKALEWYYSSQFKCPKCCIWPIWCIWLLWSIWLLWQMFYVSGCLCDCAVSDCIFFQRASITCALGWSNRSAAERRFGASIGSSARWLKHQALQLQCSYKDPRASIETTLGDVGHTRICSTSVPICKNDTVANKCL